MARQEPIIALFDEYAQALRLRGELQAAGVPADALTVVAGSDRRDIIEALVEGSIAPSDAKLFADEVCGGATLLLVHPGTERARIGEIIGRHAPTRPGRPQTVTDTIPGDASAEPAPGLSPMPTGSGSLESRADPRGDDQG